MSGKLRDFKSPAEALKALELTLKSPKTLLIDRREYPDLDDG